MNVERRIDDVFSINELVDKLTVCNVHDVALRIARLEHMNGYSGTRCDIATIEHLVEKLTIYHRKKMSTKIACLMQRNAQLRTSNVSHIDHFICKFAVTNTE